MDYRIEHDTLGEVRVPGDHIWGAQTERSLENFRVGTELMPVEIIGALVYIKYSAASANMTLGKLDKERSEAIIHACEDILKGGYTGEFPLKVWQTGSGTQTNMNVNEVIAHIASSIKSGLSIHPNDHVNMSQSSNDVFPSAMHIATVLALKEQLYPAMEEMISTLKRLEAENGDTIKIGRTHLQDAVPLKFSQEISGWRSMIEQNLLLIKEAADHLKALAIGGSAVGTGLNVPKGFARRCVEKISDLTGEAFSLEENKFHALTSKDVYVVSHGALKALAANLMKIANDVRFLSSGPRCGYGEISIPANEPGSSIMPGKVNPTQCEMVTMVAVQVMGNDAAIGYAASLGNFELNVFMPVMAYDMHQSIRLLSDAICSFDKNCLKGLKANKKKMAYNVNHSLMLVTPLSPQIGYENAAKAAKKALDEGVSLKEAVVSLKLMSPEEYDKKIRPENMV